MKKIYLVPSVKFSVVRIRPVMQAVSSPDNIDVNFDNNSASANDADAHSIWNDETSDGFNW